ncbi:NADH-quinone oxidoreductase subunit I [Rhizobium sp. 007]|uniref:NADH-quinone oxidoreductase subunit I n=1 Tax=Rhizobium sp. 007 TaxID=2785056 RepID=UPI001890454E|nr:NADH-quinone oxidoreductase subunit I [Rhizobium sp. 007]QPB24147.1 NADH-quinone oxidoreductase subunit I [Rhizobium sp. 007]
MSRAQDSIGTWIGWAFFGDLARALALTFGYMFARSVTMQYPDKEKWLPYPRYRGHHFLTRDEEGEIKCVACELCARICPCDCIEVIPYEDEKGNRHPAKFEIDTARCLFCGLCEDACPADAIALGQQYEFSSFSSRDLVIGRDDLLAKPGKAATGGGVIAARLNTEKDVLVETKETQGYNWWRNIRRT